MGGKVWIGETGSEMRSLPPRAKVLSRRVLRRWHRWGRLSWYAGSGTRGKSYGWQWFRPSSLAPRQLMHAHAGRLFLTWRR